MEKNKKKYRHFLKGSVLYTVTLVMSVMLILLLTTIALAGVANKRAFSEYHDDQTTATARSVVDAVIAELDSSTGIGKQIIENLRNDPDKPVEVTVNGGMPLSNGGYGTVNKLVFEDVGIDSEAGFYINGTGYQIIKVTAEVTMGNETTTYTQYVSGEEPSSNPGAGGSGFFAAAGFNLSSSTSPIVHGPAFSFVEPIINADGSLTWPDPFKQPIVEIRNAASFSSGTLYGSTIKLTTGNSTVKFQKNLNGSSGITALGNLVVENDSQIFSEFSPTASGSIRDIPYIYCGGTFYVKNKIVLGEADKPVNVYTGRIVAAQNDSTFYSSIYCYNEGTVTYPATPLGDVVIPNDDLNYPTVTGGVLDAQTEEGITKYNNALDGTSAVSYIGTTKTQLLNWAGAVLNSNPVYSGNFYTKGSLKLRNETNIHGNVYVGQILDLTAETNTVGDGDLVLNIGGDIVVKGQLIVKNTEHLLKIAKKYKSVTCSLVTDEAGNVIIDSQDSFNALKEAQESKSLDNLHYASATDAIYDWPAGMELSEIQSTGNKIIATQEEAFNRFYDIVGNDAKCKNAVEASGLAIIGNPIYYDGLSKSVTIDEHGTKSAVTDITTDTLTITGSCTIVGNISKDIYINPTNTITWINLYNVTSSNGKKIIVDESAGKKVYFYIPEGENFSSQCETDPTAAYLETYRQTVEGAGGDLDDNYFRVDGIKIVTQKYYDSFGASYDLDTSMEMQTYYPADDPDNMVPDIYILAANDSEFDIHFVDSCFLTGQIVAPSASFIWKNTAATHNGNLKYKPDGAVEFDVSTGNKASVIGSVFVGHVEEVQNDFEFFYVDYDADSKPAIDTDPKFAWNPIDGYANY